MNINSVDNKITLIIPVYNTEKYLNECLTSLINQTNLNFLAIIVDDGSTDNSKSIAQNFVCKYPKIFKYVYQDNKGLGGARNKGLSLTTTEYIGFLDSDDFLSPNAIDLFYKFIDKNDSDVIFTIPNIFDEKCQNYFEWYDAQNILKIFNDKDVIINKENPSLLNLEASVWRAFWKRDLFISNNITFIENSYWEDIVPHFLLLRKANTSGLIKEGIFYYRINSGNQITSKSGKERLQVLNLFESVFSTFKKDKWTKKEKAYTLQFFIQYSFWTIKMTDISYRKQLIKGLRKLLNKFHFGVFLKYRFTTHPKKKNVLEFYILRFKIASILLYKNTNIYFARRVLGKLKRMFK